jgi:hypothetical protein
MESPDHPPPIPHSGGYQHVLGQLRVLPPNESALSIVIETGTNEDSWIPYASVCGKSRSPMDRKEIGYFGSTASAWAR